MLRGTAAGLPLSGGTITGSLTVAGTASAAEVDLTGSKIYSGASSTANSWVWSTGGISGTASAANDGQVAPFHTIINVDTVNTTTSGPGLAYGHYHRHNVSANHSGGRTGIGAAVSVAGTPSVPPNTAGYVGGGFTSSCNVNLLGTTGVITNYKGTMFGGFSNTFLAAGATFIGGIFAHEIDVTILDTGVSVARKIGLNVVKGAGDCKRADYEDVAILIADQNGTSVGWNYGISFGAYSSKWPFDADSTLIGVQTRQVGLPAGPYVALNGVDLRNAAFQSGGFAFASAGFTVDPSGNAVVATVNATPVTVSGLPSASTVGAGTRAFVTDATASTFGSTVVGGGSIKVPVYSDDTNWKIG